MGDVVALPGEGMRFPKIGNAVPPPGLSGVCDEVAAWLWNSGFPLDWTTDERPPKSLLWCLVRMAMQQDADLTFDEGMRYICGEGGWDAP